MNSETWQNSKAIFQKSLEQPEKERKAFVERASKGDKKLCEVIMGMLHAHQETDDFLERPEQDFGAILCDIDFAEDDIIGQHFGPFLVKEIIGEGGMGVVYKATRDDGEFSQTVTFDERIISVMDKKEELLALDEALSKLITYDERLCKIVELRYFTGLSIEETAKTLEISPATVKREWSTAKAWLQSEMR